MISRSETFASAESGFTLFEMMVVLTIVALMTVLIIAGQNRVSPSVHARAAAQALSGALREARSEAMMQDRSVSFTLDVSNRTYRWGNSPRQALSDDLRLSLLIGDDQLRPGEGASIRFDPDGSSSGGRISIDGDNQIWIVGVDWLSGRVTIAQQPR
jgi:general secretion pathway protein H